MTFRGVSSWRTSALQQPLWDFLISPVGLGTNVFHFILGTRLLFSTSTGVAGETLGFKVGLWGVKLLIPWEPTTFTFWDYNPDVLDLQPCIFHGFFWGPKVGNMLIVDGSGILYHLMLLKRRWWDVHNNFFHQPYTRCFPDFWTNDAIRCFAPAEIERMDTQNDAVFKCISFKKYCYSILDIYSSNLRVVVHRDGSLER